MNEKKKRKEIHTEKPETERGPRNLKREMKTREEEKKWRKEKKTET